MLIYREYNFAIQLMTHIFVKQLKRQKNLNASKRWPFLDSPVSLYYSHEFAYIFNSLCSVTLINLGRSSVKQAQFAKLHLGTKIRDICI